MSRKVRLDPIDGWHHVMNRGVDRQPIFFSDDDRLEFGRCLAHACRRFGVEVHAYCLMDNHFHLLLRCPQGNLSDLMQLACGLFATAVNKRVGRVGHLFGDRFCSRLVTSNEYIAAAVRYIHRNALAVRGVERCEDFRWSSHRTYLGLRSTADFIETGHVMRWFGDVGGFASFVDGPSWARPAGAQGPIHLPTTVDVHVLLAAIDQVLSERSSLAGRSVLAQRRAIIVDIASRVDERLRGQILRELGLDAPSALSSAASRSRAHLARHPEGFELQIAATELIAPAFTNLRRAS